MDPSSWMTLEGKLEVVVREGVVGHKDQGHQHEQHRPDGVGGQGQVIGPQDPAPVPGDGSFHSSSSSLTSESSSSSLEKEE